MFSILCFERPKIVNCNFLLEVIKIIPINQLILCLICHFNYKIRNEREKQPFPPRGKLDSLWVRRDFSKLRSLHVNRNNNKNNYTYTEKIIDYSSSNIMPSALRIFFF